MLSRTFAFTKTNQTAFTSKIACPQPSKSVITHFHMPKNTYSSPNFLNLREFENIRSSSSNSSQNEEKSSCSSNQEFCKNVINWQSKEDLKNLESLRFSSQNPVEKDFFFQSLNQDESSISKGEEEDLNEFNDF